MFYSHTFLARKGPLGTVWCAAHLQHKLKKSHYNSTDIPSTVERIMYPEVPIALRMSGHLLLGVVRIYSKKVDYLYQDYNFFLITIRKAFASVEVNLPEGATHAPFHSVTLPEKFDLDAWNLDEDFDNEGFEDNHLTRLEDITLIDQVPTGMDPYITITLDEDIWRKSLRLGDTSNLGAIPIEEDVHPSPQVDPGIGYQDPGPTNHVGVSQGMHEDSAPVDIDSAPVNSPVDIMRDPVHGFNNIPPLLDDGNDVIKPDGSLEQAEQLVVNDKEIHTPAEKRISSAEQSTPPRDHEEPHNSPASSQAPDNFDPHIAFGHASPTELVIRPSPPAEQRPVEPPKGRKRKRKELFDKSTVLTNKFIKAGLEDYNDLRRKRKPCPSTALDVWKLNKKLRKENIFLEPLVTGLCADLCNVYKRDFISAKPHLASVEEPSLEPINTQPAPTCEPHLASVEEPSLEPINTQPAPTCEPHLASVEEPSLEPINPQPAPTRDRMQSPDMLIVRPCNNEGRFDDNVLPDPAFTPSQTAYMSPPGTKECTPISAHSLPLPSPRTKECTPISADSFGFESEPQQGTSVGTRVGPTPDLAASTGTPGPEVVTPMTFFTVRRLSDIPEDLDFLGMGEYTPTGVQGTQGVGTLSGTTRKVAQYLKERASVTPTSEDLSGHLVLDELLEGKSRKVSARMFSETLVLKSYGLVDVQQEEPYGNITLKLTPKLFKDLE